jgi:hypothetical protein
MPISVQADRSERVSLFPNPASIILSVKLECENEGDIKIIILNYLGTKVCEYSDIKTGPEIVKEIPVSALPHGTYYVRVTINDQLHFTDMLIISR